MPGRLFLTTEIATIATSLGARTSADNPPRLNISPGQQVLVLTSGGEIAPMRWGMVPVGRVNARGRPVLETIINARAETVFDKSAFAGCGRGVVPADGWYEWTGETRKKQVWRIVRSDGAPLYLAAIWDRWRGPGGVELCQVATVTCAPNADVRDYHHRMGVLLAPGDVAAWLADDDAAAAALMLPAADGSLTVAPATGIDWNGP